jgi:hypothetical protein
MGSVEYIIANKDPIHFNYVSTIQDFTQITMHSLDHPNNPSKLYIQCSNINKLSKCCNIDMSKKIKNCYQIHRVGKVVKVVHFQHRLLLLLEKTSLTTLMILQQKLACSMI